MSECTFKRLLDHLFQFPIVWVNSVANFLEVSFPTANNLLRLFVEQGILKELSSIGNRRIFRYQSYINLMEQGLGEGDDSRLDEEFVSEPI